MFTNWINNLKLNTTENKKPDKHWLERLTAVLLLELARADTKIDAVELTEIEQAIKTTCTSIAPDEIENIISEARQELESSVCLHNHVREINQGFTREQKLLLIEQMWRVAYADNNLDKYEEYTLRKLADLIYLDHSDFIRAKLRIIEG